MKYPIGIQSFEQIIKDGYVYVDKTDLVYQLTYVKDGITYLPIYYCMFLENNKVDDEEEMVIPPIEMPTF